MIRATTGGVMKTYRSNLMNSFINMNNGRNTVLSQRNFNSYAEDPAAAAKAFRLRKSRMTVSSQHDICADVMKKYDSAVACLQSIDDVLCTKDGVYGEYMNTLTGTTLKMLNDPTGDARTQLFKALDQMSQSIIQTMNQKYGDNFIFAGADGHNVPFEIRDNKLYYRGVPVDASICSLLRDKGGNPLTVSKIGQWDLGADTYVRADSVKAMTKEEYEKLFNLPNVEMTDAVDADGNPIKVPKEYNADGTPFEFQIEEPELPKPPQTGEGVPDDGFGNFRPDPDSESDPDDPFDIETGQTSKPTDPEPDDGYVGQRGGYYLQYVTDENGNRLKDENGNDITKLIPKSEYDAARKRIEETTFVTNDVGGGELKPHPMSIDENGNYYPDENGTYYLYFDGDPADALITKDEYDQQKLDWEKLEYLANEKYFVDIGLGFQENDIGKLIESSGFNASLNGINFLGYGIDEDGDPRNLYSLVQEMRKIADSVDSGVDWSQSTYDEFYRLVQKFEDGVSNYQTEFVNLDAGTAKLKNQEELLSDSFYNLQEQYSDIEDVDMVDAITSFIWAEYCYNAALKVGNSILSESLMDYLR